MGKKCGDLTRWGFQMATLAAVREKAAWSRVEPRLGGADLAVGPAVLTMCSHCTDGAGDAQEMT